MASLVRAANFRKEQKHGARSLCRRCLPWQPVPMAVGASIQTADGVEVARVSAFLGPGANNMAEYQAAIAGVKAALEHGAEEI
jgi:hypothetical protein